MARNNPMIDKHASFPDRCRSGWVRLYKNNIVLNNSCVCYWFNLSSSEVWMHAWRSTTSNVCLSLSRVLFLHLRRFRLLNFLFSRVIFSLSLSLRYYCRKSNFFLFALEKNECMRRTDGKVHRKKEELEHGNQYYLISLILIGKFIIGNLFFFSIWPMNSHVGIYPIH